MADEKCIKVGFFNDHKYIIDGDYILSSGALNARVWGRFLATKNTQLMVVGRRGDKNKNTKGNRCDRGGVEFRFLSSFSNLRSLFGFNTDNEKLEKFVLECDVVVARLPSEIGMRAIAIAKAYSIPCGVEVVGCGFDALYNNGSLFASAYAPFFYYKMRSTVREAEAVLYVTESFLQRRYPSKVQSASISNVEIEEVVSKKNLNSLDLKSKEVINITLIGTLENDLKGIDIAIKANKIVRQSGYKTVINIIGNGDPQRFINLSTKLGIGKSISFLGFISDRSDLIEKLDMADIYIQPSRQEGLPRSTIESMSRGCPVCASTAGGLPELTLPECTHKPGDYKKLANDIIGIIRDEKLLLKSIDNSLDKANKYRSESLAVKRNEFWGNFIRNSTSQETETKDES